MSHFGPARASGPEVTIHHGRLYWPGRSAPADESAPAGPTLIERIRDNSVFIIVLLYLLFNWGFQQVRIPPVAGGGIPIGEIVLIMALVTLNHTRVLGRLSQTVYLLPFLLWWAFGAGRALVDFSEHGTWALRDAAHVVESMFLLLGFVFASYPSRMEKFFSWLPKFLIIGVIYGLLFPVHEVLWTVSPTIITANGYEVPIIGSMASAPFLLMMAATYLILFHGNKLLGNLGAVLLIGYTLAMFQARTLYLLVIAVFAFMILYRRSSVGNIGLIVYAAGLLLGLVTLLGLQVQGRLGAEFSPDFFFHHFMAIFGISSGEYDAVTAAAAGVDQRLGWWQNIFSNLFANPFTTLLGLGYGVPLTDFHGTSGAAVREPHNSYITVVARTGLVGALCWVAMMLSLVHRWHLTFRRCRELGWRLGENRLMLLMTYFICIWVLAIGEDGFEKPYNIIPFYFFWGIVLRFAYALARGEIGPAAEGYAQERAHDDPVRA